MIARTTAVVEPGGVLGAVRCAPPLTLRQVRGEAPDGEQRCELRLVGTAAGPLAGDDLALSLEWLPGARATLRAAGASVAQGGGGARTLAIRAELGEGADLIAEPGTLVACAGSRVDVQVEIALGAGAAVDWRELIVLGRTGEPGGQATLRWDVTRCGEPVLRQFADLGPEPLWVVDHHGPAAHFDDDVVPGRHDLAVLGFGGIPARRDVGLGPLEQDKGFRARRERRLLVVAAGHVRT